MARPLRLLLVLGCVLALLGSLSASAQPVTGETVRVSISSNNQQASSLSTHPSISANGLYVAFDSLADNLVSDDDKNGDYDIFVKNIRTGEIERVSVRSGGAQANDMSIYPSISADGRFVAFMSLASNLFDDDTNWNWDVFVHDRQTGETKHISAPLAGTGETSDMSAFPSISADGNDVAFFSEDFNLVSRDTNNAGDVFVHNLQTGVTELVSVSSNKTQGNGSSEYPSISKDGRYVAFHSDADNLIVGDTNGFTDVFVRDRVDGVTTRVSVSSTGQQGNGRSVYPAISADGRYVAFYSYASNLVDGDDNSTWDVFVHDRQTGVTERIAAANTISDWLTNSEPAPISANGRFVAFVTNAAGLVDGDNNESPDVFVHDRKTGETTRVSVSSDGQEGNGSSNKPAISPDGRFVAFSSNAPNLVDNDTNDTYDVFVHDRCPGGCIVNVYLPAVQK